MKKTLMLRRIGEIVVPVISTGVLIFKSPLRYLFRSPVPVILTLAVITDPLVIRITSNLIYIFWRGCGYLVRRIRDGPKENN